MKKRILIIDDEKSIQDSVAGILLDEGFEPLCAGRAEEGLGRLEQEEVDLVLLDIWMPGMDGMEALQKIKERWPHLPVIMISGHGTIETAVQATKMGAYDFIEKPPSYEKLVLAINNAMHYTRLAEENRILMQQAKKRVGLTGNSPVICALKEKIERVAPTDAWVLILGEHGTGKELVAQSIHRLSRAGDRPMIDLNCAAIPEELIESELFGHEKGAFTGATASKRGKFDLADGGTLFLDEIADMSLKTQAKILRILQEQKFERVGGSKTISVNVRVLAATNKNLEEEIKKGNFPGRSLLAPERRAHPRAAPARTARRSALFRRGFPAGFCPQGAGKKRVQPGGPGADGQASLAGQCPGTEKFRRAPGHHVSGRADRRPDVEQHLPGLCVDPRPMAGQCGCAARLTG